MATKTLPPAILETGVACVQKVRTQTTQGGKPISLVATIREMKVGHSFWIDESTHEWRARVNAARSHVNRGRKVAIRLKTQKTNKGTLLVTRI